MLTEVRSSLRGLLSPQRLLQFMLVGLTGAVFDMGTLTVLYGWVGVALLPAKVWAAEVGIVVAFVLNEAWTFADQSVGDLRAKLKRFLTSNAIRTLGIGVAVVVLVVLKNWFGMWYVLANALGLWVGGLVNYAFEAVFAWEVHR